MDTGKRKYTITNPYAVPFDSLLDVLTVSSILAINVVISVIWKKHIMKKVMSYEILYIFRITPCGTIHYI